MTTLWFEQALLPEGWRDGVRVEIAGGLVSAVTAGAAPGGAERHAIGLPGLPNLHSHAFQRGMAGLSERRGASGDSFWTWREIMYRFVDTMGPDEVEAITAFAFAEMLEAGYTRVGEFHYLHHAPDGSRYAAIGELSARIGAAAATTGIALTLLPVFYAHANFGGAPPTHGQRRFLSDRDGYARLLEAGRAAVSGLPDAVLGVAPHSLRAATPDEIDALLGLADGPVHLHAAEQVKEVEDSLAATGKRPVEFLLERFPVDARWCLIHATHMTKAETVALARSGAAAGLCPLTEASLGDGIFPTRAFMAAGGRLGVGSDSNIIVDPAAELRALEAAQRLALQRRNVLAGTADRSTGRALFEAGLAGGAQALGAPGGAEAGILAGLPADIVSLDAAHPSLVARSGDALLDSWIFAARRPAVDCVWRRGARVVAGGRHRDAERITNRYREVLGKLIT